MFMTGDSKKNAKCWIFLHRNLGFMGNDCHFPQKPGFHLGYKKKKYNN